VPRVHFFLGRQSRLSRELLEACEVGIGVAPEAALERPGVAARIEPAADVPPALPIHPGKIARGRRAEPRGRGGDGATAALCCTTGPRSTAAGEAVLRPVARRSW
jgi:hypothetical protein